MVRSGCQTKNAWGKSLSESGEAKSVSPPAAPRRAGFVFFDVYKRVDARRPLAKASVAIHQTFIWERTFSHRLAFDHAVIKVQASDPATHSAAIAPPGRLPGSLGSGRLFICASRRMSRNWPARNSRASYRRSIRKQTSEAARRAGCAASSRGRRRASPRCRTRSRCR